MRLCHIVPSLEDRHGGPSRSVRALANGQAQAGHEVDLLSTADHPAPVSAGDPANLEVFARAAPRWLTRSPALARRLQASTADLLHHHSLWLLTLRYTQEAAARRGVPYVISPRGMMSGWAYRHRRWRKALAELFVHPGAFEHAAGWHATSKEEADDIHRLGFRQPVCISPNGVVVRDSAGLAAARDHWLRLCPAARSRPVALFYSRFHRKKRLRELIDLWLAEPRGDWLLLVAGLPEEHTVPEIAGWIATARAADRIAVHDGTGHPPPYALSNLFLLPSHSENFGLVIAEALAAGVPALVTDTTPWRGLAENGCGWCVPWEQYGAALGRALAAPSTELQSMGVRGRTWVEREYSWSRGAGLLLDFYRNLKPAHA